MKTSYLRILPLLLTAVLVAACSSDIAPEEPQNPVFGPTDSDDEPVPVEFRVSAQHTGDFTRATESIVTFTAGEAVKVCVSTDDGSSYTGYDFTAAADGQSVALNAPSGDAAKPYFPAGSGTSVKAYAYYPTSAAPTGSNTTSTFTVADDQTSNDNYKASDLMYSTVQTITKPTTSATLNMAHKMAQLKITAQAQSGSGLTIHKVVVKAKKSVTFTPASGTATATDAVGDITALTAAGTGYILIPQQTISDVSIEIWTDATGTSDKKATFSFTSTDNFVSGNSYPIDLTVSAAQLGANTAISNWNGQESVTYAPSGDLTIEPITSQTYKGSAFTASDMSSLVTVKKGTTTLTYGTDYDLQLMNNTNAGTAIVVAQGKSGTDYAGSVAVATFTINQLEAVLSWTNTSLTYNGSVQQPTCTVSNLQSGDVCTVTVTGGQTNYSASAYTATASSLSNSNYKLPSTVTQEFSIAKADPSVTPPTAKTGLTYNGSAQALINAGSATGGTMYYSLDQENWYTSATDDNLKKKDANTSGYAVYYKVTGNDNYNDVASTSIGNVVISKAAGSVSLSSSSGTVTAGSGSSFTVTGNTSGGALSVSATSGSDRMASGSPSISGSTVSFTTSGTSAGSATIRVTSAATANYNSAYADYTLTINAVYSVGQVICSDGTICNYTDRGSKTVVAVIVYVGATGESSYTHGLALALSDANSGSTCKWKTENTSANHSYAPTSSSSFSSESGLQYNSSHNSSTYPAFQKAIANNGTSAPSGCSAWFLPSAYQWNLMKGTSGKGSYTALRDCFSSVGGTNMQSNNYWSCTEYDADRAWCLYFGNGIWSNGIKTNNYYVRSALAF